MFDCFFLEQQEKDIEVEKKKFEEAKAHVSTLKKELVRMSEEVEAYQVRNVFYNSPNLLPLKLFYRRNIKKLNGNIKKSKIHLGVLILNLNRLKK